MCACVCVAACVCVQEMGDMRNKIIQKKRLRMHDARDRLHELAKQGDARERLNKMRRNTAKPISPIKKVSVVYCTTHLFIYLII